MKKLYLDPGQYMPVDGVSECCGAPSNTDLQICTDCGEHCTILKEEDYYE